MKKVTLVLVSTFIITSANIYDINSYCQKASEAVGGSCQIMQACIEQELNAENSLYVRNKYE